MDISTNVQSDKSFPASNDFFITTANTNPQVLRVVNEMKKRNDANEFVEMFAKNNGYPIWDKACIPKRAEVANRNNGFSSFGEEGDSLVIIPIVHIGDNYVSGFIYAVLNDSVQLNLYRGGDYNLYSFNTVPQDSINADAAALQIMWLNHEVFGHENFTIQDNNLFKHNGVAYTGTYQRIIKINSIAEPTVVAGRISVEICNTIVTLSSNGCSCQEQNPATCVCTFTNCCWVSVTTCSIVMAGGYSGGVGGGPIGGPTGSPTGGNGGGSPNPPPPNPFPCPSTQAREAPLPGCTPAPLPPVLPIPPLPTEPCNPLITSLKTNATFKAKFLGLRNNLPNPDKVETGEIILDITDSNKYLHVQGVAQSQSLPLNNMGMHQAIIHRHYYGLNEMFSSTDVWNMMLFINANVAATPNDYFWGMLGPNDAPYIMKVKDASKLITYLQSHNFDNFDDKYGKKFNFQFYSQGNIANKKNEVGFLMMLKEEGLLDAIELYRGNDTFSNWDKLSTDSRNVNVINCQ